MDFFFLVVRGSTGLQSIASGGHFSEAHATVDQVFIIAESNPQKHGL